MSEELPIYVIPEWNFPILMGKIEKLKKRADKVGLSPVSVNILSEKYIEDPRISNEQKKEMVNVPKIKVYEITVSGAPKLEGWKFVGTLDHVTIPNKVIVNTVPNETVPKEYFHHDGNCDHCNKKRFRNETFVVANEDGETKAVGRNCLKDFLGHNPAQIASYLESLYALFEELEDDDHFSGGGYYVPSYTVSEFLEWVAPIIRIDGWTPRSASGTDRPATASTASYLLNYPYNAKERKQWLEDRKKYASNEIDLENIEKSIQWIKDKPEDEDNSYFHNLKSIVDADFVNYKLFGYTASIVSSYLKEQDRLRLKKVERESINNEYLGEVGQRYSFKGYVKSVSYYDTQYGTSSVITIQSDEGNQLVLFTTASFPDKGVPFTFDAKVKEHKEYNDVKQTVLQRPTKITETEVE